MINICIILFLLSLILHESNGFKIKKLYKSIAAFSIGILFQQTPLVSASGDDCTSETNNSGATISFCRPLGLDRKGSLKKCESNTNCYSSSSKAAERYLTPWSYSIKDYKDDSKKAWSSLEEEILKEGLTIIKDDREGYYLLAAELGAKVPKQPAGSSLFYEFLLKPADSLVLQRAIVDKTVMLYPLQQPVSDFGALKGRLDNVRIGLQWQNY